MGLVPSKITKKWYSPKSSVYQNFIYLFRNPLWHKDRLPTGFPECMLFWACMFSLCVFRPSVWVIRYMVQPLIRLSHLGALDRFLSRKLWNRPGFPPGMGLFLTSVSTLAVGMVLFSLGAGVMNVVHFYRQFVAGHRVPMLHFWVVASFLSMLVTTLTYKLFHRNDSEACPVHYYLLAWPFLALAAYLLVEPALVGLALKTIGVWIGHSGWVVLVAIWSALCWIWSMLALFTVWSCKGIARFALAAFKYSPFWHIPLWADLLAFAALNYAIGRRLDRRHPFASAGAAFKGLDFDKLPVGLDEWRGFMGTMMDGDRYREHILRDLSDQRDEGLITDPEVQAFRAYIPDLQWQAVLDCGILSQDLLEIPRPVFEKIYRRYWADHTGKEHRSTSAYSRVCSVASYMDQLGHEIPVIPGSTVTWDGFCGRYSDLDDYLRGGSRLRSVLTKAMEGLAKDPRFQLTLEHYVWREKQAKLRAIRREHSALRKWCKATTETLGEVVHSCASTGWAGLRGIGRGIRNGAVAIAVTVKSLKSGACHYYVFDHDGSQEAADAVEEAAQAARESLKDSYANETNRNWDPDKFGKFGK